MPAHRRGASDEGEIMAEPGTDQIFRRREIRFSAAGSGGRLGGIPPEEYRAGSVGENEGGGGAELGRLITKQAPAAHHYEVGIKVQRCFDDRPPGRTRLKAKAPITAVGMVFQHGPGPFQNALIFEHCLLVCIFQCPIPGNDNDVESDEVPMASQSLASGDFEDAGVVSTAVNGRQDETVSQGRTGRDQGSWWTETYRGGSG